MMKPSMWGVGVLVQVIVLTACAPVTHALKIGDTEFQVEVAETEQTQRAGLSGRQSLPEGTGMVQALDAGPVYRSVRVELDDRVSSGELLDHLAEIGAPLLVDTLCDVAAGLTPTPQIEEGVTSAAKLHPDDVRIDWSVARTDIARLVRAANPTPMAWTMLEGERLQVLRVAPDAIRQAEPLAVGQLAADRKHLWVGTGDGDLELLEVKAAGRKAMRAVDWARGRHEAPAPGGRLPWSHS